MFPQILAVAAEAGTEAATKATGVTWGATSTQLVGIIVVFFCLVSLAVVVWLVGKVFIAIDRSKKPAPASAAASKPGTPAPTAAPAASGLTPQLVAVIAAAVDTALDGRKHRILNISQSPASPWAISGRTDIFASHRLRK